MNAYTELKEKHTQELNTIPIRFAFTDKQFQSVLDDWNVSISDLRSIAGGGIIRKIDSQALKEMFTRFDVEMQELFKDDDNLTAAFLYELQNHEYGYTYDASDALEPLGLELSELNEREQACLSRAKAEYWQGFEG